MFIDVLRFALSALFRRCYFPSCALLLLGGGGGGVMMFCFTGSLGLANCYDLGQAFWITDVTYTIHRNSNRGSSSKAKGGIIQQQ